MQISFYLVQTEDKEALIEHLKKNEIQAVLREFEDSDFFPGKKGFMIEVNTITDGAAIGILELLKGQYGAEKCRFLGSERDEKEIYN